MYKLELKGVVNFLESKPTFPDLAIYLGTNACISGELSKVWIGKIEEEATITCVASFGYEKNDQDLINNLHLLERKPICLAMRKNVMIVRNNNDQFYEEFPEAIRFSDPWKTVVCLPLSPRYMIAFALQIPMDHNINHYEYFEMLGLVLRLYINLAVADKDKEYQLLHSSQIKGKPLTPRQELIFSLLERGLVNREIAKEISYSESLVRQETVIIFAKLGVTGRKALLSVEVEKIEMNQ